MKKNVSYRDRLIELSKLYKIDEIKNYIKSKKNLTVSQIELILFKNKIRQPGCITVNNNYRLIYI